MYDVEKIEKNCLRCKYFRLVDQLVGKCKIDGKENPELPEMKLEETCSRWEDSGQQYHIRLGWLKNKKAKAE